MCDKRIFTSFPRIFKDATLPNLHNAIRTILSSVKSEGLSKVAILKCSSGPHGSSIGAIKAEAITELVAASELGLDLHRVAPQALRTALKCGSGQRWQDRARQLYNAVGEIKYWNGTDGAVCAAYKASMS
jgi:hypothetical protein